MPFDATSSDLEVDFELLEAVGRLVEDVTVRAVRCGGLEKTIRRWLIGHRDIPDDPDDLVNLMAMANDLELFTPSMSGRTSVDRFLDARKPETDQERAACAALRAARFHLVRVVERDSPDLIRLRDLATQEDLVLLNSDISPLAAGAATAMRLCPLPSGRHVLISPTFRIDETMLAAAMTFVRPGKALGNGHRCAANLYRDVARQDFTPLPTIEVELLDLAAASELSLVQDLAARWLLGEGEADRAELIAEIRRAASLDNLVDACGWFASAVADGRAEAAQAFQRVAEILMETIDRRARAGVEGYGDIPDRAVAEITQFIARDAMHDEALALIRRLRALRFDGAGGDKGSAPQADSVELDKVIQRIRALRAKTVDQGCTEQEAMAAAAKVAELLDRHDLSLDELTVRASACIGAAVETGRRRRAPIDACLPPIAAFCDCQVWSEEAVCGHLRFKLFGLKADVEAARFLHDLVSDAFETETAIFRQTATYLELRGPDRRTAANSFQVGLASGIGRKLKDMKRARAFGGAKSTGFDLVAVKHAVVDEEMERLGLRFRTRSASARRYVFPDAYHAGEVAGAQFEPEAALPR